MPYIVCAFIREPINNMLYLFSFIYLSPDLLFLIRSCLDTMGHNSPINKLLELLTNSQCIVQDKTAQKSKVGENDSSSDKPSPPPSLRQAQSGFLSFQMVQHNSNWEINGMSLWISCKVPPNFSLSHAVYQLNSSPGLSKVIKVSCLCLTSLSAGNTQKLMSDWMPGRCRIT